MTPLPPVSEERVAMMRHLATRLFPSTITVFPTDEDRRNLEFISRSLYSNPKTNRTGKSLEDTREHTTRGFGVEEAVKKALGLPLGVARGIDLTNPETYAHDVKYMSKKIEVKSISKGFEHHDDISYHQLSASTLIKHREILEAVVFGTFKSFGENERWEVDITWVINPDYFCKPYLLRDHDNEYYRYNPRITHCLRSPNASLWNRRILTDLTFEE